MNFVISNLLMTIKAKYAGRVKTCLRRDATMSAALWLAATRACKFSLEASKVPTCILHLIKSDDNSSTREVR